jgi:xylulokinase
MTAPTLLGVDLGTSSVKVVVTDQDGRLLSQTSRVYDVESANVGWAESDPQTWWRETVLAVREAVGQARAGGAASPSAIGLSGQMHGVVLVDAELEPVRPAILWADTRASVVMGAYDSLGSDALARLANPTIPGLAGPILLWLRRFDPAASARARWALQPKDWLRSRMTGVVLTEPSDASATLLYDVPGERWDTEVIAAFGLDRTLFPTLASWAGESAGDLTAAAADELGLAAGIRVAAGAGDTAAAMFGSGLREPGTLQLTMGSGGQIVSAVDQAVRSGQGTTLFRTAARHGWYVMAATSNAGLALDWVRTVLAASWDELYAAAAAPGRETDPLFLPHLTGERTPWLDSTMRGGWVGLALAHDRTALLRSALEGVAFAVRTAMDEVGGPASPPAVRIAGGGTTHPAWRQLLADILGRPLDAVDVSAASGRGAALLGGCAADLVDEASVFGRLAPSTRRVSEPRPDPSTLAAARHQLWLKHVSASRRTVSDRAS